MVYVFDTCMSFFQEKDMHHRCLSLTIALWWGSNWQSTLSTCFTSCLHWMWVNLTFILGGLYSTLPNGGSPCSSLYSDPCNIYFSILAIRFLDVNQYFYSHSFQSILCFPYFNQCYFIVKMPDWLNYLGELHNKHIYIFVHHVVVILLWQTTKAMWIVTHLCSNLTFRAESD